MTHILSSAGIEMPDKTIVCIARR